MMKIAPILSTLSLASVYFENVTFMDVSCLGSCSVLELPQGSVLNSVSFINVGVNFDFDLF